MADELTREQLAFMGHDPRASARMLAGPGTGKSRTCVEYLGNLVKSGGTVRVRMLTFTRAATKEFTQKLSAAELGGKVLNPSTVHGFALSLLTRMPDADLPQPLRIPDAWENKHLIRPHLAALLNAQGHIDRQGRRITPSTIEALELSMASGWQSLDPSRGAYAPDDPLRLAYQGQWERHRRAFGYVLLAELPYQAKRAVENFEPRDYGVDLLLVDEYQDLNAADIGLFKALADRGLTIVAIGDDDQSIYSWREAAPQGIRQFPQQFGAKNDYPLTISQRCGINILAVAQAVIAKATDRPAKEPLKPRPGAGTGRTGLVRFANGGAEAQGVAEIIAERARSGISVNDIAVLVRSSIPAWTQPLRNALQERGIKLSSIDWVNEALAEPSLRRARALALLAVDREDSLAWWSLIFLEHGVGPALPMAVYSDLRTDEPFGRAVLRIAERDRHGLAPTQAKRLRGVVVKTKADLENFDPETAKLGASGWGGWLEEHVVQPTDDVRRLLQMVGSYFAAPERAREQQDPKESLRGFLGQLEPVAKDLAAAESDGVRIMTMASSKGLTVNTAIVMGVERGIVPLPRADVEEERRLLYVALTRATDVCLMTFARRRFGVQARLGGGYPGQRLPSEFLSGVVEPIDG